MPTASLHRLRERRVEVLLNEAYASAEGRSGSSPARSSSLLTLAPALAVFCGVAVFFVLSQREKVWPQAEIQHYAPAVEIAPPAPAAAVAAEPKVETVTIHLRRSRRFSDAGERLQLRLVRTDVRRQFADVDVRTGRNGFRRVRVRVGQSVSLPGTASSLRVNAVGSGRMDSTLNRVPASSGATGS